MVQEIWAETLRELRHIFLLRTQQLYMYPQKPHPQLGNCTHMQAKNSEEHVYFSSGNSVFPHFVLQVFASLSGRSYVVPGGSASKGWVKPAGHSMLSVQHSVLKTILMPSLPFHNYRKKATKIHSHFHYLSWRQWNLLTLLSHYVCAKAFCPTSLHWGSSSGPTLWPCTSLLTCTNFVQPHAEETCSCNLE